APAAGNALTIASEACASGSPAVRNVTSAARPSALSAAKRLSIRVVIGFEMNSRCILVRLRRLLPLLAHRCEAHVCGTEHQANAHADEIKPFLALDRQPVGEQPDLEEPDQIHRRDDDQQPAGAG